jgi:dipeptidyl aminopeptidase/acylaminoacyl peptidase
MRLSHSLRNAVVWSACALLYPLFGSARPPQSQQRPFKVDDLFEIEDIGRYFGGPYAFSPDGQKLAFTRVRAKKTLANHKWEYLWDNAGGDVWVQLSPTEQPVNITNGAEDGSGWWSPQWSPDGSKLALLSTRGGNVCAWLWDVRTRKFKQLTHRAVDIDIDVHERPYLWVDSEHLLVPVLPGDSKPSSMITELQTPMIATKEWPKVEKGVESTVNVLESGVPIDLSKRPQGDLLLIDVSSGTEKSIVHAKTEFWQLSPNAKVVSYARQVSEYTPKNNQPLPFGVSGLFTIEMVSLDGSALHFQGEMSGDVLANSTRWSPDGNELAFVGWAHGRDADPALYRVNLGQHTITPQYPKELDVAPIIREQAQIEWTSNGDLVIRAAKHLGDAKPTVRTRRDWYVIAKDGSAKCLTQNIEKDPPREVWPQDGRQAFIGVADSKIWRLNLAGGSAEDLTAQFGQKVSSIAWPSKTNSGTDEYRIPGRTYNQIVFDVRNATTLSPYLLELNSGKITPIKKPGEEAVFEAYDPKVGVGIYFNADRNGLEIWRTDVRSGNSTSLATANTFLRGIAEGEFKSIEYTSLSGEKLKGWLLLPYGYQPGKRYPMLAWVYAGSVYSEKQPSSALAGINSSLSLNMEIPAANGYVVLFPSMPNAPEGIAEDAMLRLPEGVLPAVDKAVEMGIADPDRLFLMGQSFGGFSTYGLVTQTQRFKAAASLAGLSDLVSLWGQFGARERYTDYPQEDLFMEALMEGGQVGLGGPPWKEWNRYIRNSPIFYVDRVQTPLMIIQGDMDYVAIQQGEEFFMSLYRQGKRAKFVRYWGEGHVLESPANIRDMWKQIFGWFDEFSMKK